MADQGNGFVVTRGGRKFHRPVCKAIEQYETMPYVPGMRRYDYVMEREVLLTPCGLCRPAGDGPYAPTPPPRPPAPVIVYQLGHYQLSDDQVKLFLDLVQVGYKRLASVHHPDVGGSVETMRDLNALKSTIDRTFRVK
jgi:hypothetical protein